ncbi:MAG: ABC transporter substrate-binding protein [Deltaproteobacteria bacterium]|nr:ABC transporter substrate-binding protein [Deltaproteobacteria bacterium]MBW2122854.1 ABC transporter substrate-binding protein [Deltaproteobacteria bacterium]
MIVSKVMDPTTYDPVIPIDNPAIWDILLMFDQLVRMNREGTGTEPGLAESVDVSDDGLVYTFHLRRGVKFHDGTPMTAEDVKFSIDRLYQHPRSFFSDMFQIIKGTRIIDPYTFEVTLKKKYVPFLSTMALFSASIVPKKYMEAKGEEYFGTHPVGTGPFKFVEWRRGDEIVLERFKDHWRKGMPYLDAVRLKIIPESNTRILNIMNKDIHVANFIPYNMIAQLKANPDIDMQINPLTKIDFLLFNHLKEPYNDLKIRQAMNYAVDRKAIIKSVLFGYGEVANTFLPNMLGLDRSIKGYTYDLEKAKQLMKESSRPNGFKTTLLNIAGSAEYTQRAVILKEQLAKIGIDVNIEMVEEGTWWDRISQLDYEISDAYMTTDIVDPDELLFFACVYGGGSKAYFTSWRNEEFDKLARATQTETDHEKRMKMYSRLQQMQVDDAQLLLLYRSPSRCAVLKTVHNFKVLPTGNYRLEEVWLEE